MIAVTAQTRIWLAREPADFRCGIDGLAKICRTILKSDPFSGSLFVFRNRRSKSIKILACLESYMLLLTFLYAWSKIGGMKSFKNSFVVLG